MKQPVVQLQWQGRQQHRLCCVPAKWLPSLSHQRWHLLAAAVSCSLLAPLLLWGAALAAAPALVSVGPALVLVV